MTNQLALPNFTIALDKGKDPIQDDEPDLFDRFVGKTVDIPKLVRYNKAGDACRLLLELGTDVWDFKHTWEYSRLDAADPNYSTYRMLMLRTHHCAVEAALAKNLREQQFQADLRERANRT